MKDINDQLVEAPPGCRDVLVDICGEVITIKMADDPRKNYVALRVEHFVAVAKLVLEAIAAGEPPR